MEIIEILIVIAGMFIFLYALSEVICFKRNKKYQELWEEEKAMRLSMTPRISRAELCEYYVMFRLRNDCDVEF